MLKFKLTFLICLTGFLLGAQTLDELKLFEEANTAFKKANQATLENPDQAKQLYLEAAREYQYLADKNPSSVPILMNLGNAYYFAGDNGRALLNYHRALVLDPTDKDVRHNLNFVRSQCIDQIPEGTISAILGKIFFWHKMTLQTRLILFGIVYLSCWLTIIVLLFRKSRPLRNLTISTAVASLLLGISVLISCCNLFQNVDGVITVKESTTYQGDGYIYSPAFTTPLHSGTEFDLLEKRPKWYYIQLTDGSKCWIPAQNAELIKP